MPVITEVEVAEFEAKEVKNVVDLRKGESEAAPPSSPEAEKDLQDGVGAFAGAVDTITSSLLLVIGKTSEGLDRSEALAGEIAKNNRVSRLNSVLGVLLVVGVAFTLYRVNDVVRQNKETIAERRAVTGELVKVRDRLEAMKLVTDDTKKAVAKAETEAAQKPTVEIVPDDKGGAKVVIRQAKEHPKDSGDGPKTKGHPKPKNPPSPPPALEIPINLPPGTKSAQPAPQHP
jgi:hypothetical protein